MYNIHTHLKKAHRRTGMACPQTSTCLMHISVSYSWLGARLDWFQASLKMNLRLRLCVNLA